MHIDEPVLITGAYGGLGGYVSETLLSANLSGVVRTGRGVDSDYCCDLTNSGAVSAMLSEIKPKTVLHFAAATDVDRCELEPLFAWKSNVQATKNIVEALRAVNPTATMLYASTDQVYSGAGPHPESDVAPINVYGLTKLWGEEYVRSLSSHLILRVNFFGTSKASGLSLTEWLRQSSESQKKVKLFSDVLFNPLHVRQLTQYMISLLDKQIRGTYNVGSSGGGVSKSDFLLSVADLLELDKKNFLCGSVDDVQLDAKRPKDMRMVVDELEAALGEPVASLYETVRSLVSQL